MLLTNITWKPIPLTVLALLVLSCLLLASGGFGFSSWWPSEEGVPSSKLEKAYLHAVGRESQSTPSAGLEVPSRDGETLENPEAAVPVVPPRDESHDAGKGTEPVKPSDARESLMSSLLMILVSELGDKTFLIAAIMSMTHSPLQIFSAAFSALVVMSVLSAALGYAVPNLIPRVYTHYLAALLFLVFGAKMFMEGLTMDPDEINHEYEEVQVELADKDASVRDAALEDGKVPLPVPGSGPAAPTEVNTGNALEKSLGLVFSKTWVTTFVLTFLAEWGDRSQFATIALAAAKNVYWVTIGTVAGHSICTALAVKGGRLLATKISVRTVTLVGALLFLIFSLAYLYEVSMRE